MPGQLEKIRHEDIIKAIELIDTDGVPPDAQSIYYDLLHNNRRYPPKLVISIAHKFATGELLPRDTFPGGKGTKEFKLLEKYGFVIVNKDPNFDYKKQILNIQQQKKNIGFSTIALKNDLKNAGLYYSNTLIDRFIGSLLTKPFVLLTGLSGSGKTRLAQSFAEWICTDSSQYRIVPVGADWTNREPLLGYPNALDPGSYIHPDYGTLRLLLDASKPENRGKPYFLILDEMNLSHVERYFADFLSAMESNTPINLLSKSGEKQSVPETVKLPSNLFIIGTVNIDETTYMFSPKVLDRANVIEFRITEKAINIFLNQTDVKKPGSIERKGARMAYKFVELATDQSITLKSKEYFSEILSKFFIELKKVGAEFGYRSAFEALRFAAVMKKTAPDWTDDTIMDAIILQKLLPKLHGSRRKLEPVLKTLAKLCMVDPDSFETLIKSEYQTDRDEGDYHFPESYEKIRRMYNNLIDNGFTSFAEA